MPPTSNAVGVPVCPDCGHALGHVGNDPGVDQMKSATGAPACADQEASVPGWNGKYSAGCEKQLWEWSVRNTCAVAALATGEAAAPLCEGAGKVLAELTYPLVQYVMKPLAIALQKGIMALIPDAWTAQAIFDPVYEMMVMWNGGENLATADNGPVVLAWRGSVASVEEFWNKTREAMKLAPAPVSIRAKYVMANATAMFQNSGTGTVGGLEEIVENVTDWIDDAKKWLETAKMSAEDALAMACYQDETKNSGWGVQCFALGFFNSKTGWVISEGHNPGAVLEIYQGQGPFAIKKFLYWDSVCKDNCLNQFHNAVATLWSQRLKCVQRAMPSVLAAIVVQLEQEANPKLDLGLASKGSEHMILMGGKESEGGSGLGTVVTIAALGGAVAAGWYYWPQISSFFKKKR